MLPAPTGLDLLRKCASSTVAIGTSAGSASGTADKSSGFARLERSWDFLAEGYKLSGIAALVSEAALNC